MTTISWPARLFFLKNTSDKTVSPRPFYKWKVITSVPGGFTVHCWFFVWCDVTGEYATCVFDVHCAPLSLCLMWRHRRVRNLRIWRALYTTESLFDVTSQESTQPASLLCKLLHMRVGAPPAAWVLLICFGIAAHTTNVCCMLLLTPHCHTHYHTHCHTHSIVCSSSPKSSVAKQKEPTNHFREASMYYYWERYFISSV